MGPGQFYVCQQVSTSLQSWVPGPQHRWLPLAHWRTWHWRLRSGMAAINLGH